MVRIVQPTERYLIDDMDIKVEVAPPEGLSVRSVEVKIDGKSVSTMQKPPFELKHDFGERLIPHRIDVIATLSDGSTHTERFNSAGADLGFESQVSLITLTVAVQDRDGHYVMDLTRERFRVLENGRPQKITYFANETQPLKLALALDCSGSMESRMPSVKVAAIRFLERKRPEDEVMIVRFNQLTALARALTAKVESLKMAIANLRAGGGTRIYDAIYACLMTLKSVRGQRAVVILTDGRDESDRTEGSGANVTAEEALRTARELQVPIYAIGLGEDVDVEGLRALSERSGGRAYFPGQAKEMDGAYDQIQEDLDHRYTLAYESTNRGEPGEWMSVEVRIDDPLLTVRHAEGYAVGDEVRHDEP